MGGAAGSLGGAELAAMGFELVAVNILELAIAPGLGVITEAGGLGAFHAWPGPLLALVLGDEMAAPGGGASGWRARRLPAYTERDGELAGRSPIDGSSFRFSRDQLEQAAADLGAVVPGALGWWRDLAAPPPPGDVVSALPAEAARAGLYLSGGRWLTAAEAPAATAGALSPGCACRTCAIAGAGYIAHLWRQREITAAHLLGRHNLHQARLLVEGPAEPRPGPTASL